MSHDRVMARQFSPSTKEASPAPAGLQLPPDLLSQSCKRVGIAALVFAGLWLAGILIHVVGRNYFLEAMPAYMQEHWPVPGAYFASAGVLLSLIMLVLAGKLSHRPVLLLDIGLVFLVLTSAIAVLAGSLVSAHFNEKVLSWIAGCGFIVVGLWTILRG